MSDHAPKDWLRTPGYHAPQLVHLTPWILALIGAALLIAGPVQWWFTWAGEQRIRMQHAAERQAAIELCEQEGATAFVEQKSGAIVCARGSDRLAPLGHPLKGGSE